MRSPEETTKPVSLRLPAWASDFVERRCSETGETKTQVVLEALSCLRAAQVQALMREGHEEMRTINCQMAEDDLAAGTESLPEW